jgi:NAD(P)-dependent dehydrogenase (short-subunit alcohol dehydrogenase family)
VDGDAVSLLAAELGPDVLPLTADVSSEAQVADMAAAVRREFGGLDGLVNSARPSLPPRL